MSAAVLVPLCMLGGIVVLVLGAVIVWRAAFRDLYPNCNCPICGRRRR